MLIRECTPCNSMTPCKQQGTDQKSSNGRVRVIVSSVHYYVEFSRKFPPNGPVSYKQCRLSAHAVHIHAVRPTICHGSSRPCCWQSLHTVEAPHDLDTSVSDAFDRAPGADLSWRVLSIVERCTGAMIIDICIDFRCHTGGARTAMRVTVTHANEASPLATNATVCIGVKEAACCWTPVTDVAWAKDGGGGG